MLTDSLTIEDTAPSNVNAFTHSRTRVYGKPYDRFVESPVLLETSGASTAGNRGCESIVVPAVGCGLGGLADHGAEVIVEEIRAFDGSSLYNARVIAYSDDECKVFKRVV